MPASPAVTPGASARRPTFSEDDGSCACRSPKRARSSPSPRSLDFDKVGDRVVDSVRTPIATPLPLPSRASTRSAGGASMALASALAAPAPGEWGDEAPCAHPATSPCRSPARDKSQRRRELSVPLLSQSLSHFSLSHSTPPLGNDLWPEAMTLASSSTPPLPTPSTVTDTPRRLPHMRRMNTPAPLARELTYPNTAPMPVIHSLLGSPFNTKSRYPYDSRSPSWAARGPKEPQGLVVQWQDTAEWMEDNENTTLSPGQLRARPSSSSDEGSEGCASASSFLSSERYAAKQSMRQTVGIWDDEPNLFGDADHHNPATPNRQLFAPKGKGSAFSARVLSPVLTPPFPTRILPGSSSEEDSPVQPFRLARMPSPNLGASTSADPIPMRSPSAGSFLPRRVNSARRAVDSRQRGTTRGVTYDGFLSVSDAPLLGQRRTSEPNSHSTGDAFAAFLARCGGERATQSELCSTNHRRGSPQPPDLSSEPNDLDLDLSPLRSLARSTVPSLPNRPLPAGLPSSPSAPTLGLRSRLDKRNGVTPKAVKATPTRSQSARIPPRPKIHRGVTDSSVPTFGTPVSQLFGDDKPSPAAFASTGLMKKKGGRMMSLPRFQQMVKTRSWTPAKTEPEAAAGTLHGFSTDTEEIQLDDSDEPDQLSPIRPFRSAPFRRTGHTRVNSTASDITATSPFRRPVGAGHARMSSTASSIGGTRGLRRKGSSMFNSSGSIGSAADMVSDNGSPATPTKALPFIPVQPKFGISTPSPTVSRTCYPFDRRMSIDSTSSPTGTPMASTGGRMRVLSRGPIVRASNPMLASTFRAHSSGGPGPAGPVPSTPAVDSAFAETFMTDAARAAGAGRFERDFTLVQALGSGEFSSVWKVRHKNDGDLWAIKTGRPYTGHKNRLRQLEEVSILKQLSHNPHPGIVKYSDSWEQGGRLYIRTELAECGDLARYLGSLGDTSGLDEGRVWKMLVELSSALEFIHNNGILHLDFKPSNVLLTREGSLKVADFGMSIFLHPHGTSASRCPTPTYDDPQEVPLFPSPLLDRELEGDREYLCPEVLHDAAPGPEADVYSLGILVLEAALNIALPSNGESWIKLRNDDFSDIDEHYVERGHDPDLAAIVATAPGDPLPPAVSAILVGTVKHMMAAEPSYRMTLAELGVLGPMVRTRDAMMTDDDDDDDDDNDEGNRKRRRRRRAGPPLADEEEGWIEYVLGEAPYN